MTARHQVWTSGSRVERRSAAGEWLLWFALGGGPPDFWEVPCLGGVMGWWPCRAVATDDARQGGTSLGGLSFGWVAAVEDDLLDRTRGVTPKNQLLQVVPVGLARGPP